MTTATTPIRGEDRERPASDAAPALEAPSRAITRRMTQDELRVRDLQLAECRRVAANARTPTRGCR